MTFLLMACASPLIALFAGWPEPRLLRVASVCVVVALAGFYIYLFKFIYSTDYLTCDT